MGCFTRVWAKYPAADATGTVEHGVNIKVNQLNRQTQERERLREFDPWGHCVSEVHSFLGSPQDPQDKFPMEMSVHYCGIARRHRMGHGR